MAERDAGARSTETTGAPAPDGGRRRGRGATLRAAALAAALLAGTAPGAAQEPPGVDVTGRVVERGSEAPVGQAMVSLEALDWGVFADEDGGFRIEDVRPGTHTLRVERLGYRSRSVEIRVAGGGVHRTVRLEPRPVALDGIRVVTDRFERRRKATPVSVRAFDRRDLVSRGAFPDVLEFIEMRAGVPVVSCPTRARDFHCVLVRGRRRAPTVYIDEAPAVAGLDQLEAYRPEELYMVEVFARGAHIRAYTRGFMERAAERRLHPIPLFF